MGVQLQKADAAAACRRPAPDSQQILEHTFPTSIIDAMARGEVLQIVVFSFLFGTACAAIGAKARPVVEFCESLAEVMFRYTNYVMLLRAVRRLRRDGGHDRRKRPATFW